MLIPLRTWECWAVFFMAAVVATWEYPRFTGVWLGVAIYLCGWSYLYALYRFEEFAKKYILLEFLTCVCIIGLGSIIWFISTGVLFFSSTRKIHQSAIQWSGTLSLAAMGLAMGYFATLLLCLWVVFGVVQIV